MSDTIETTYGSCLDIDFEFFDVDGNPEDIGDDDFGILLSSPPAFAEAVFTKTDAENGKLHMFLAAEHARKLGIGKVNWFRLRRNLGGGCEDNTTPVWVDVK